MTRTRSLRLCLVAGSASLAISTAWASAVSAQNAPSGGEVIGGSATITSGGVSGQLGGGAGSLIGFDQNATNLEMTATGSRVLINWNDLQLASGRTWMITQDGANAILVNRVIGGGQTTLSGTVNSNGQVWILNPNGVVAGAGSTFNVGGLLFSNLGLADADILDGNGSFNFTGVAGGTVALNGAVTASAGVVALIGSNASIGSTGSVNEATVGAAEFYAATTSDITFVLDENLATGFYEIGGTSISGQTSDASSLNIAGSVTAGRILIQTTAPLGNLSSLVLSNNLTATKAAIDGGDIVLSAQSITLDGATLSTRRGATLASADGDIFINGTAQLSGSVTVEGGSVSFFDGIFGSGFAELDVASADGTTFRRIIDDITDLTVSGLSRFDLTSSVTVDGDVTLGDVVIDGSNLFVSTVPSGTITVGVVTDNDTTPSNLQFSARNVIVGGLGSSINPLGTVTFGAETTILSGDVYATGAANLGDLTLAGSGVRRIEAASANFQSVNSLVSGTTGLSVITTGQTSFNQAIGSAGALASLGVDAGSATFTGTNQVGTFAADVDSGGIAFRNGQDLTIGAVDGVVGVRAATGSITIDANGELMLNGAVTDTARNDSVTLTASDAITGIGRVTGGQVTLSGEGVGTSAVRVNTTAEALAVDGGAGSVWISEADSVSLRTIGATFNQGGAGYHLSAGGTIEVYEAISASGGDLSLVGASGNLSLLQGDSDLTASGTVTLTTPGALFAATGSSITASDVVLSAGDWSGDIFQAAVLQESDDLSITDTLGGLTLGALSAAGDLSVATTNGGGLDILGLTAGGGITVNSAGGLTITGVVAAPGDDVSLSAQGNLTLNNEVSGRTLILSTPGAFVNNQGSGALLASDRWIVYSAAPAGNTFGGLNSGNTAIWNGTLATRAPGTFSGNRYVFAFQPTLTFTSTDVAKTYGDLASLLNAFSVNGFQAGVAGAYLGDTAATVFSGAPSLTSAGTAATASVLGGPYVIDVSTGTLTSLSGYAFAFNDAGLLTVNPLALTAGVTANSRTYDGTTAATGSVSLTGVINGDDVGTTVGTFTFDSRNAGLNRTVRVSGVTLTGADAGNYTLTVPASTLADILQRAITATATADDRVYDGTTAATGSLQLNGVVAGDNVSVGGATFTFDSRNAGVNRTVTISGATLTGADAGNYTLTVPASTLADILQRAITATATADDRVYDGTTAATGSLQLNGVVAGDNVSVGGATFTFDSRNAGVNRTVTISGATLTGADAGNYTLTVPASTLADILQRAITATATAEDRVYDGTTAATGSLQLNGVVAGDNVSVGGATFTFDNRNAGVNRTVTISGVTLTGADAGNYTLTVPASTLADILRRAIVVTADNQIIAQGEFDPPLTWQLTQGSLVAGDSLAGALTRAPGRGPGVYAISQGTLAASDNYTLTFVPGTLRIEPQQRLPLPRPNDTLQGLLQQAVEFGFGFDQPITIITDAWCDNDDNCAGTR
jgi:filamentous hemagglutinin family protein